MPIPAGWDQPWPCEHPTAAHLEGTAGGKLHGREHTRSMNHMLKKVVGASRRA
jgi:hypothetical protein